MPRSLWLLIIGMMINVTAASFLWPLNTIYIHEHLGKSLSIAGLVLFLNAGAGVLGNLVGGMLFDKVGGYKSILLGIIITLLSVTTLIFIHKWPQYVILLTIIGFGGGMVFPAMYAMAGAVWPEGGRKSFNAIYVAQNVGVAIGAAIGGLLASYSFTYIFLGNAVVYSIFLLIALFGYKNIKFQHTEHHTVFEQSGVVKSKSKRMALYILCVGYLLAWMAYVQWQTTLAAHTQSLGISLKQYSLLWAINGGLIVLGQPLISYVVKYIQSLKQQIIIGLLILGSSFFVAAKAEEYLFFVVAMVILTIGEMFVWPAVPAIADSLAPKGRKGFYQGVVNSAATGGRMLGPIVGGQVVDLYGMDAMFRVFIGLILIAIISGFFYDHRIKADTKKNKSRCTAEK